MLLKWRPLTAIWQRGPHREYLVDLALRCALYQPAYHTVHEGYGETLRPIWGVVLKYERRRTGAFDLSVQRLTNALVDQHPFLSA